MSAPLRLGRSLAVVFGLSLASLAGCSGDGGGDGSSTKPPSAIACEPGQIAAGDSCRRAGWATCPAGFVAEGNGCRAVAPSAACADGERPRIGSAACEPLAKLTCPSGFAQDGLGCREILPSTRCSGATRDAIGQTTCLPLGDCSAPVAGATHFVDPAFTAGQLDATHFTTLAAALAAAPSGAVVELATGTYKESVSVTKSVTIAGRCAANVVLDGEDQPARTALTVGAAIDVELRGITLTRYEAPLRTGSGSHTHVVDTLFSANHGAAATANDAGTTLTIERTAVRGTVAVGSQSTNALGAGGGAELVVRDSSLVGNADKTIMVKGAKLTVDTTLVADTALDPSGNFGSGIVVLAGADATVTGTAIIGAKSEGLYSEGTLALSGSVVRDTGPDGTGTLGRGVNLWRGTSTIAEITVDGSSDAGISLDRKATLAADHVVVRDTGSSDPSLVGAGILVVNGSSATVKRAIVLRSKESGAQATTAGSTLALTDSFVASGRGQPDGTTGDALVATEGGVVTADDSAFVDSAESALTASGAGSSITATGCVIADTRPNGKGRGGFGARAGTSARVSLERSAVLRNHDIGLIGTDAGSSLALTDVEVSHTTEGPTLPRHGRGLEVNGGASAVLVRASFVDDMQVAVVASGVGSSLDLTDVEIAHTRAGGDGLGGRALTVQSGASAKVASSALVDQQEIGIAAVGDDSTLELDDSFVSGTHQNGGNFGHGVVAAHANVTVVRTHVEGSDGAAFAFADSRATISASVITKNAVGFFVNDGGSLEQAGGVPALPDEPGRILVSDDTRLFDNVARVSGGILPIPPVLD
jgi:hypothetical protein